MAKSYRFSVVKFASHALRGEVLNVGLLVESDAGTQILCARKLEKIRAISAALDPQELLTELQELPALVDSFNESVFDDDFVRNQIAKLTPFKIVQQGSFEAANQSLFDSCVDDLLNRYVEAEPALPKAVRKRHTRLRQSIKTALNLENILAKPSEGLDSHRVIYKHQLAQGVIADFVLQNGAMHVVESVDATSDSVSLQRCLFEIAMSTLTFEHARINFDNRHVKPRLIYEANHDIEKALAPSLYAAQHQGAEIINWASIDDRNKFLVTLASLADPSDSKEKMPSLFHASDIGVRKLN